MHKELYRRCNRETHPLKDRIRYNKIKICKLQMENLNVTRYDKGVAKCPFNPHANITTLMTENGQMFVGSPTDFSGSDPAILRADVSQVCYLFLYLFFHKLYLTPQFLVYNKGWYTNAALESVQLKVVERSTIC